MFFRASIATVLTASLVAVYSAPIAAPVVARADFTPQACSGPNLTGTCTDLATTVGSDTPGGCTNLSAPALSLKLNVDNDCVSFTQTGCTIDFNNPNDFATEHFSDDADINDLTPVVLSVSCQTIPGLVNGLFPQ
ncbi:hypothetical protein HMN09_00394800 [Mycena chlorophos]|uniref:Uncharacterized protein n=2 Tax=Mycena chlorophos TaxID=658473 RepID=A0A146I5Q5_MYCCL|nr:hypothetical protein HMN09_00394800 [Mycena chlorophos]GAT54586.1 predicted protein [Mycena chlorophos]